MNLRTLNILLIIFLVLFSSAVYGQHYNTLFQEGNSFYQNDDYNEALQMYLGVMNEGFESGELYYNIGNTYYKLGNMGKTILFYERARRFIPDDEDLINNITLVNISLADRIEPLPEVFYIKYWNSFRNIFSITVWKLFFFVSWFFVSAAVTALFFTDNEKYVRRMKTSLISFGIVLIIITCVFVSKASLDKTGLDGIVMEKEVSVYSSPNETGTEVFLIHEGAKIRVKRRMDDWVEIRLEDGNVGWLKADSFEII
ncbi:hypothetical protein ACFL7D_06490 [candidate division KSB1 bacterium]